MHACSQEDGFRTTIKKVRRVQQFCGMHPPFKCKLAERTRALYKPLAQVEVGVPEPIKSFVQRQCANLS